MTFASATPAPNTCYQIICDSMVSAGKLGQGREPNSEQLAENKRRLNKLVNYFQTQGLKLFAQQDIAIAAPVLQVGLSLYTLGPLGNVNMFAKPRRVIEGYFTDASASRRPLLPYSRNEWDNLSTVTKQGPVVGYFVDKQESLSPVPGSALVVNLWLAPDTQAVLGTVHLIVDVQIGNFNQLTDTSAFPIEWSLALEWGLANQICTGMPQEIVERCAKNAEIYQTALENWDVEDASTIFQPDPRGGYSGRRVGRY